MISNELTTTLGIDHPIISAPMGGISGSSLTKAVSQAGGLGLVGVSYGDANFIEHNLATLQDLTSPWGVGCVMFTFAERPELWKKVMAYAPPVIALSFGDAHQVDYFVHSAANTGAKVVVQVHDVEQALIAKDAGASVLVAQGAEAGGHHKTQATLPLIPAVVDAVEQQIPVVAAGGFADGRGLAAALSLGASGIMMGTRFALSQESLATPAFTSSLLNATAPELRNTRSFDVVRGIPWDEVYTARSVTNDFVQQWTGRDEELAQARAEIEPAWTKAVQEDDANQKALFAGEVIDLITEVEPAAAIINSTVQEAIQTLESLNRTIAIRV